MKFRIRQSQSKVTVVRLLVEKGSDREGMGKASRVMEILSTLI